MGKPKKAAGQPPVQPALPTPRAFTSFSPDADSCDALRLPVEFLRQLILEPRAQRPTLLRCRVQNPAGTPPHGPVHDGGTSVLPRISGPGRRGPGSQVRQVGQVAAGERTRYPLIALQQSKRHPARAGQVGKGVLDDGHELRHSGVHSPAAPSDAAWPGLSLTRGHLHGGLQQGINAVTAARRCRHDRDAQLTFKPLGVHSHTVAGGLIDQIEADHHAGGDLQDLQDEIQVALQAHRVHHNDRDIRVAEQDEIPCHLLIRAPRLQGVGTRQVDHLDPPAPMRERPLGSRHRLAGPVARVLSQASQGVEDRGLSDIRVARQGDQVIPPVRTQAQSDQLPFATFADD